MRFRLGLTTPLIVTAVALGACPDDGTPSGDADSAPDTTIDTVDTSDTADTAPDIIDDTADTAPDTTDDTADTAPDTTDDTADTAPDTTADTTPDGTTAAVPGARCALSERIGLVTIEDAQTVPPTFYASLAIDDRANPWYGAPELATDACDFHHFAPEAPCPPCADDELCGLDGTCHKAPVPFTDAALVLSAGGSEQRVVDWAQVTLPGDTFAFDVTFGDQRVTLGPTASPGTLEGLGGTLAGGYEAPTALDIHWTTSASGTHVFTHIPMNHHAAAPTFTECTVPADAGGFHVDEPMLMPLAVITGLEFQGVDHARFAAAETPLGCVELRFSIRHFVNLQ